MEELGRGGPNVSFAIAARVDNHAAHEVRQEVHVLLLLAHPLELHAEGSAVPVGVLGETRLHRLAQGEVEGEPGELGGLATLPEVDHSLRLLFHHLWLLRLLVGYFSDIVATLAAAVVNFIVVDGGRGFRRIARR